MESLAHAVIAGVFALLGATQKVDGSLSVRYPSATVADVRIVQTPLGKPGAITSYDVDMTKLIHLVVISSDFTQFQHLHPTFDKTTGAFSQRLDLNPSETYYVYADTTPTGMGQQVLRFTLKSRSARNPRNAIVPVDTSTPEHVALDKTTLVAGKPQELKLEITRNGKPATGLQPYLGAAGHAVFINTKTLQYAHVHPMLQSAMATGADDDMSSMKMGDGQAGPHLMLHVPPLPEGTYRLWFQFRDADAVRVAPFTIIATKKNNVASNTIVAPLELLKK